MNGHTTARRGKRIVLILHDGTRLVDKLVERRARHYVFERAGKVDASAIRSFSIARGVK